MGFLFGDGMIGRWKGLGEVDGTLSFVSDVALMDRAVAAVTLYHSCWAVVCVRLWWLYWTCHDGRHEYL